MKKQNERLAAEYDDYDDADWDDGELDDEMSVRNVGDEFGRILGDALKKRWLGVGGDAYSRHTLFRDRSARGRDA